MSVEQLEAESNATVVPSGLHRRPQKTPGRAGPVWRVLSRISPLRRFALVAVAVFEIFEGTQLLRTGWEHHNPIALALGFIVLLLLLGFEFAEHATAKRDQDLAREISQWLLPHWAPSVEGIEVVFRNRMANHVGSDYFHVFPRWKREVASHRLFVVMADVAGSGLQGALLMATFQASLRVLADSGMSLAELATSLNQWSWDRSLEGRHFTMAFLADLDADTGRLDYVVAGHQPPLVRHADGSIVRLDAPGFPFGALDGTRYQESSTILEPNDLLLVFSDGVIKAESHRQMQFGEERLVSLLDPGGSANETIQRIETSMLSHCGSVPQPDDLSYLVLRRLR